MYDLILCGNAYVNGRITYAEIGILDGKIAAVRKSLRGGERVEIEDGTIFPAATDIHVHFREPGLTHKEDFLTGTAAAACGGVTMVAEMPNTVPFVDSLSLLREKMRLVEGKAIVDFALYLGVSPSTLREDLAAARYVKLYLSETTNAVEGGIRDIPPGPFVSVHAEEASCIVRGTPRDLIEHHRMRPVECEVRAVERLCDVGRSFHIAHATSFEAVYAAKGCGFTVEVTPHHLLLRATEEADPFRKVNPPLRPSHVVEGLWDALGSVDVMASDHAPHTPEEKEDFKGAPSGIPGVETMVPLMFRLHRDGRIRLDTLVRLTMETPPSLLGVRKGRIAEGYDADLMVVDLGDVRTIHGADMHSRAGWTPYEGWEAIFPSHVMLRGEFVVEDGELVGTPGMGICVHKR